MAQLNMSLHITTHDADEAADILARLKGVKSEPPRYPTDIYEKVAQDFAGRPDRTLGYGEPGIYGSDANVYETAGAPAEEVEVTQAADPQPEAPKNRGGRPRKNPPAETSTSGSQAQTDAGAALNDATQAPAGSLLDAVTAAEEPTGTDPADAAPAATKEALLETMQAAMDKSTPKAVQDLLATNFNGAKRASEVPEAEYGRAIALLKERLIDMA